MQYCRRLWINAKYNGVRALSGKICFTLLMEKMHLDIDEQRKCICCLNVMCLSKYIRIHLMDSCSFVYPTICMCLLSMSNLLLMSPCALDGGLNM